MKSSLVILHALLLQLLVACSTGGLEKPRLLNPVTYSGTMARSMSEGSRSVKGRLEVRSTTSGGFITAIITTSSGKQLEAEWPEWSRSPPFIDPSKTYEIELMTRIYKDPDYVFNDILRVSDSGQVLIDSSVCHVHHLTMKRQIEDGHSAEAYPNNIYSIRSRKFPNDGNIYLACGSGIRHPMWRCMECYKQYQLWTKSNGIDPTY